MSPVQVQVLNGTVTRLQGSIDGMAAGIEALKSEQTKMKAEIVSVHSSTVCAAHCGVR